MIVNSVIQSANLRGGARLSDIFQHQVFMVGGEFRVDAAVVHEAVANVPRDDWNAKRTNSIGSRRSSPSRAAAASIDSIRSPVRRRGPRRCFTDKLVIHCQLKCPLVVLCPCPVRVGIALLRVTTLAASHLSARG